MHVSFIFIHIILLPILIGKPTTVFSTGINGNNKEIEQNLYIENGEEEIVYFFDNDHSKGFVNQVINLTIYTSQEVSALLVTLPEEANVQPSIDGLNVEINEIEQPTEWLLSSKMPRSSFHLPLIFESTGQFVVQVGEVRKTIDISPNSDDLDVYTNPEESVSESNKNSSEEEILTSEQQIVGGGAANIEYGIEVQVATFTEFQQAVRNDEVTKINVVADIAAPNATITELIRSKSLLIEGNGHVINMRNNILTTNRAVLSGSSGIIEFHHILFDSEANDVTPTNIRIMEGWTSSNQWTVRFGNVTTTSNVTRLAINDFGRVEMYGENVIDTRYENFILSDMELVPGTTYIGNVNLVDVSIVWYRYMARESDSASASSFLIGEDSYVRLDQTQTIGTTYPAVYLNYKQLTVGENATFTVRMPGNAVRLQVDHARMDVLSGAFVHLSSTANNVSVVSFSRNNTSIEVHPEAEFFASGHSSRPVIDMASNDLGTGQVERSGNHFELTQPRNFDLRNTGTGTGASALATTIGNGRQNQFSIYQSDIDLWHMNSSDTVVSDQHFSNVEYFSVNGRGSGQSIETTVEGLTAFNQDAVRRISGMSQSPEVVFEEEITDAHITIRARVIIGYLPDIDNVGSSDEVAYSPVYAKEGQATGTLKDSFDVYHKGLVTDAQGYLSYFGEAFQLPDKIIRAQDIAIGERQTTTSAETTVIAVTPPDPVQLSEVVYADAQKIVGMASDFTSTVDYTINGIVAKHASGEPISTKVNADGSWVLPIVMNTIKEGDILQIFLTDCRGNRNPIVEEAMFDAIFPAATTTAVVGNKVITPVDPIDPETEIVPENPPILPENQGQLSIDFVSQFEFGRQAIKINDHTYYANPQSLLGSDGQPNGEKRPNFVQVTDRRVASQSEGWQLSVTQSDQFADQSGNQLTGAQVILDNQELVSAADTQPPKEQYTNSIYLLPGSKRILLTADSNEGMGTWLYRFGNQQTAEESIALFVPKETNPQSINYTTIFTWELNMVPVN